MGYRDLREFISMVEKIGALKRISGANAHLEIGALTEIAAGRADAPALLFDDIPGLAPGMRVFTNATVHHRRAALALGLSADLTPIAALRAWKAKRSQISAIPPVTVTDPEFLQNRMLGPDVDLTRLPAPLWHGKDGGPYIGSGSLIVMRDPESGWINASIYRVQLHGPDRCTIQFDHPGRHGAIIARKYWERSESCPVAIVSGQDPALFMAGFEYLPEGISEYDFAGAIKGQPIELTPAPTTAIPVPARAEIIIEGQLLPFPETSLPEGPFGEFTGYYAAEARPAPVMQVTAIHHRDDPILLGSPPMKPPRFHFGLPLRAAGMWRDLEAAGVSDVTGVWQHVSQLMTVIALRQRYGGHAKRAGLIAAAQSYMGRLIVTVDDDVDPSDLAEVMWAVTTRAEPSESVDIIRDAWSSALDPRIPEAARALGITSNSKMIINACRPFEWRDRFPPVSAMGADETEAVLAKWAGLF